MPPARDVAASSLLQPGMRIVWFGGAASIPGERSQIEPNVNGEWVNKRTGERYTQFETPGPAGLGFTVMDVMAAEPNGFLLQFTMLLLHTEAGNTTTFIDTNGAVAGAQNISDFWQSPAQLAQYRDRNEPGLRILHMPYTLGNRTFRAIRIQTENQQGWSQNTFDLDTGVALASGSTTQGGPVLVLGPGHVPTTGAGSTLLTFVRAAGARLTSLPGPGAVYPDAIRRLRTLSYSGSKRIIMPGGPGAQLPPFPLQIRYDIGSNAGPYLNARMTISGIPGAEGSTERLIVAGAIGSLWMSPDVLARFGTGETLDQDALTGVRAVALGRQNNLALVALQTGLARNTFGYDLRSGLLTRAELRTQIGIATDVVDAQLVGTQ